MTHLLLWGNAYAQIIRNGKGEVIALYPLMPDQDDGGPGQQGTALLRIHRQHGRCAYGHVKRAGLVRLTLGDVLHIPGLGFDGLVGYSPIAMAKNAIGMAIACEEYGAKFFRNGAAPGGVLEHPGQSKTLSVYGKAGSPPSAAAANANKIAVLGGGHEIHAHRHLPGTGAVSGNEEVPDQRDRPYFRVPPHMVGDLENPAFPTLSSSRWSS